MEGTVEELRTALPGAPKEALNIALDPVLDLRAASTLIEMMQMALGRGLPFSLDAGAVSRMSTACVQVLAATMLDARKGDVPLTVKKSSPAFDAAFANLGLGHLLDTIKQQDAK